MPHVHCRRKLVYGQKQEPRTSFALHEFKFNRLFLICLRQAFVLPFSVKNKFILLLKVKNPNIEQSKRYTADAVPVLRRASVNSMTKETEVCVEKIIFGSEPSQRIAVRFCCWG